MAHFCELDENNRVIRVLVVDNKDIKNEQGYEDEEIGKAYLQGMYGADTKWVQTSYNSKFRGGFAGKGDEWDGEFFVGVQPYPSWTLNWRGEWESPAGEAPDDGRLWFWDEENLKWEYERFTLGDSWTWDADTHKWVPPVPLPDDAGPEKDYQWDEENQEWVLPS